MTNNDTLSLNSRVRFINPWHAASRVYCMTKQIRDILLSTETGYSREQILNMLDGEIYRLYSEMFYTFEDYDRVDLSHK